jgi:hypothetical protein
MMDRGSISVDIITPPAVSKTGKAGLEPGFLLCSRNSVLLRNGRSIACGDLWPALKKCQGAMFVEMRDKA